MTTQPSVQPAAKPTVVVLQGGHRTHYNLFAHSSLFYWWPVWAYGYFCAAMTYLYGVPVKIGDDKVLLFYPASWLGLSFLGVFLFVLVFSTTEARGIYSYVLAMILAAIIFIPRIPGFEVVAARVPDLRVHMNLAFFVSIATGVLFVWALMVVVIDRFTYWKFEAGHVTERHVIGQAGDSVYPTIGLVVRKMPTDFFRHWVLGFGSGDIKVTPQGQQSIEVKNVLRVRKKLASIEQFVGAHADGNRK